MRLPAETHAAVVELSEHLGDLPLVDVVARAVGVLAVQLGVDVELPEPPQEPARHEYEGELLTAREIAVREGVSRQAIEQRIARTGSAEKNSSR